MGIESGFPICFLVHGHRGLFIEVFSSFGCFARFFHSVFSLRSFNLHLLDRIAFERLGRELRQQRLVLQRASGNEGAAIVRKAGGEFGRRYGGLIAWIACGVAGVAAPVLSFGGVFVWCRRNQGFRIALKHAPAADDRRFCAVIAIAERNFRNAVGDGEGLELAPISSGTPSGVLSIPSCTGSGTPGYCPSALRAASTQCGIFSADAQNHARACHGDCFIRF